MNDGDTRVPSRRELLKIAAACLALPGVTVRMAAAAALRISNRLSPLNSKRPKRPHTRYIILHTTEGEEKGSLNKLVRYGEAHYFVSPSGKVLRIIDKSKIARHTGRSMWEGRSNIDNYSIGVEVCGYHNRDITPAQTEALKELLRQLKSIYNIPDERILTHSMVAYGRPNRFHNDNHRGRKRCGMIFARPEIRERLGIHGAPAGDPDVQAGKLKVADPELFSFLFPPRSEPVLAATDAPSPPPAPETVEVPPESPLIALNRTAWHIARERYNHPSTVYVFPDGRRLGGDKIQDWGRIPSGTRVLLNEAEDTERFEGFLEIGKDGDTPAEIAGVAATSATTIYFFPDGLVRTGAELKKKRSLQRLLKTPPKGTRLLVGYVYGGHVKSRRPATSIAGTKWNYPSTYYRYPDGRILSGDDINAKDIPGGTLIFYQQ
ncbi:MAG: N-acetylmuramoyl-L-alanine amidase [Acidobacteria bacterium]|jgi:N-acetylmuramoyl-L-alanine amidase|nr:N-acetylmuramoyl-L-alanine amidase [Acidobacteriota bacterium]